MYKEKNACIAYAPNVVKPRHFAQEYAGEGKTILLIVSTVIGVPCVIRLSTCANWRVCSQWVLHRFVGLIFMRVINVGLVGTFSGAVDVHLYAPRVTDSGHLSRGVQSIILIGNVI